MSELTGAVMLAQLDRLDGLLEKMRAHCGYADQRAGGYYAACPSARHQIN